MHGASLTSQKSGDEKILKKYGHARGEKSKKCEGGVFHRQDWSQFNPLAKRIFFCKTNICEKHPLIAKKLVFILKNYLTNILPLFFWCCMVAKYLIYNFTFTFHAFFLTELIKKCSFCPLQIWNSREIYLKYLDADKMRGKSIWNIWTRIKWEAKFKILNVTPPIETLP